MAEPRNHVRLSTDVAGSPDEVFDYFTNQFDEIWPGKMEHVRQGRDQAAPLGHGFVRRMHTPAGKLEEEIVTHDRPGLIEYRVINGDEAKIHNHLGRIELTGTGTGTHVDYTIDFDYRPAWQGPISARFMQAAWHLKSKRRLAKRFRG